MKYILILPILFLSISLFGQKDKKHIYKLNPEAELIVTDTLTLLGRDTSGIKLTLLDIEESPIIFCKVTIENSDTLFNTLFEKDGIAFLTLSPGNWTLKITSSEFNDFKTEIQLNKNQESHLAIHLVELEERIIIYSNIEISQRELDTIKYCLATNEKPNDCFKKEYKIVIEI